MKGLINFKKAPQNGAFFSKKKVKGDEFDNEDLESTQENLIHIETKNLYYIYLDESINNPCTYRSAYNILRKANEGDVVTLIIDTDGGYVNSATQFVNYLIETKAHTIAEIHNAYSAGAIIAMVCDEIKVKKFASMMIHSLSGGLLGKTHEIAEYNDFLLKLTEEVIGNVFKGFLTKNEIQLIFRGKDLWLFESDIKDKLKDFVPYRKRRK